MSHSQRNSIESDRQSEQKKSLWRNRDYLLLWSGQIISLTGTNISQLAFPLLVLSLTGSPAQAGIVGALRGLPFLLLSLPAGALVDRWNRKTLMICCDTVRAIALGSIPLAYAIGHLTILQLYITALLEGTLFTFFNLAETACLPQIVAREQLTTASAWNETSYNFTFLIGPLLGGTLYSLGKVLPFLTDALSYLLSVCSLGLIRAPLQQQRTSTRLTLWTDIRVGLLWLWRQPLIRYLSLLTGCINLVAISSELIVIVIAQAEHASPFVIGIMFTAAGIASTIGALLSAPIQKRIRFGKATIGICWLTVLLWPLYFAAFQPLLLTIVFASIALVGPIYNVMQFSYRITLIPNELQGRVNSIFRLIAFGLQFAALALTGILLQRFGTMITIAIFLMFLLILAVGTTVNSYVRSAPRHSDVVA